MFGMYFYFCLSGIGLGLLYTPSIVVVNLFFDRRRTVITGVAMSAGGRYFNYYCYSEVTEYKELVQ